MAKPRSLLRMFIITEDRRPALFWRVVGYAVVFGVCLGLRNPLQSVLQHSADSLLLGALGVVLTESVVVALAIAATTCITYVFRCKVDRRPWAGMALPAPWRRSGDIGVGFALGTATILVVVGLESGLGWFRIAGVKDGFDGTVILALLTARFIHFIGAAVCEEVAYRSYLPQNVAERFPLWLAVLTTGAVFALSHSPSNGFGWGFVVSGIIGSFFLALMRLQTQAIWLGVGWHMGWDWFQDGLGLVPGYSSLRTERLGPPLWVGRGMAIEGGLLIAMVLAAGLAALVY